MYRTPRPWLALCLVVGATLSLSSHADARAGATITASFSDSCRDVAAHASKDISHVVIRYADGREVKDETIDSPDYAIDGGPGDEIASLTVKASVTRQTFTCHAAAARPPVALLETPSRCVPAGCTEWTATDSDGSHERCNDMFVSIPFRGTNSSDPDGDLASWSIDFGDGTAPAGGSWTTSPPAAVGHTFPGPALATVTLTVTDATGLTGSDTIVVCLVDFTPD